MYTYKELLAEDEHLGLHDVFVGLDYPCPTPEQCQALWDELPVRIRALALEWGPSDTEYRDAAHVYLEENPRG